MTMHVENCHALITGGASGLGYAVSEAVIQAGGRVVILDYHRQHGEQAAAQLGVSSRFIETNVASSSSVEEAVKQALDWLGQCHLLVNCAGVGHSQRVLGKHGLMETKDFTRLVEVNLNGCFYLCRAVIEHMQLNEADEDGQRGVMINTASIAAYEGQIGQSGYAASKGGVVSLTLPLAREFARFGVRVMCIAPGLFATPMFEQLPEEARESLLAHVPFPARAGDPKEFAALVEHIFHNPMLNGEVIRLDAALRMQI